MEHVAQFSQIDNQAASVGAVFDENLASLGAILGGLPPGGELEPRSPGETARFMGALFGPPKLSKAEGEARDIVQRWVREAVERAEANGDRWLVGELRKGLEDIEHARGFDDIEGAQHRAHEAQFAWLKCQRVMLEAERAELERTNRVMEEAISKSSAAAKLLARQHRARLTRRAVHVTRRTGDDGDADSGESDPPKASPRFVAIASQQGTFPVGDPKALAGAKYFDLTNRQLRRLAKREGVAIARLGGKLVARVSDVLAVFDRLSGRKPAAEVPEVDTQDNPRERVLRAISGGKRGSR